MISNDTTTYTKQSINGQYKYVVYSHTPSILPYNADVYLKRGYPKLLSVLVDGINSEDTINDPYNAFFDSFILPPQVEKKLLSC